MYQVAPFSYKTHSDPFAKAIEEFFRQSESNFANKQIDWVQKKLVSNTGDKIGVNYSFSVPGLARESIEVEVKTSEHGVPLLIVKALNDTAFCAKGELKIPLDRKIDYSTAKTSLQFGVLSIDFKYKPEEMKSSYKIEIK